MRTSVRKAKLAQEKPKEINGMYQYIDDVLEGRIVVGRLARLAVARHVSDMETAEKRGFVFVEEKAERILRFFSFLKHSKGEWSGASFKLENWQKFFLGSLFGWCYASTGFRRFKNAYLEVARKNGKSTLASGIALYELDSDGEMGAEVYSAATTKDQAKLLFTEAQRMVESSPGLSRFLDVYKESIASISTMSVFKPLAADAYSLHGLNTSCAICDEVHAMKSRDLWDVIKTSTVSRRQPIMMGITTAGTDMLGICRNEHDYLVKILDGVLDDDSYFGMIFTLDEGDNWHDQSVWCKANPNLGVSVDMNALREEAFKAENQASYLNSFLRLHMNIWTNAEAAWVHPDDWNASCPSEYNEEDLLGMECWGGMDLSTTTDISAVTFTFRMKDGTYRNIYKFWIPRDNIEDRVKRDRVPYDVWVRQGYVEATDGKSIDYKYIKRYILECAKKYKIRELAYDPYNAPEIVSSLIDEGLEMVEFRQGFLSMSPATKSFEMLVLAKKYNHNNNPVMRWMVSNVVLRVDPAGNVKPDKSKSIEKIDGVVSSIMSLQRAVVHEGRKPSVYMTRGVLSVGSEKETEDKEGKTDEVDVKQKGHQQMKNKKEEKVIRRPSRYSEI